MSAERTTITINPAIREQAEELMRARAFSDFSGFIAQLIRDEYERRHGHAALRDLPSPPKRSHPSSGKYQLKKKPKPGTGL